ncbi:C40 family peptidase [Thauera aromatica]|uniref:C40 family peptidase n=1 Tax=Thauera aromatica TaxID=59405 RepID=UPI001FFDC1AC|nr:C40 family peptidase [Thauera aromatica]MCK2096271.1 C40 family peptidase [Thauera aromatica]
MSALLSLRRLHLPAILAIAIGLAALAGCSSAPVAPRPGTNTTAPAGGGTYFALADEEQAGEMVLFALGLLDTGYRFGGRNPEAGLDCSGMVAYIVENISGQRLPHNAAQIAKHTRPIALHALRPGDLIFFNTLQRRHSHMGIYIGDGRFIHAPSSRGAVRVERLDNRYFAQRIDGARTLVARN